VLLIQHSLSNHACGQDHYCGIYSAYVVLDYYERQVSFESLLEPQYVAGFQGSSTAEVLRALVDHGVAASHFSGLEVFDLRTASGPLILHVRGSQGARGYDHWVVYMGEKDGLAMVLDPSRGLSNLSYSRLLSLWDGVGIASASSPSELKLWRILGIAKRWAMLVVLGCLIVPLLFVVDRWKLVRAKQRPLVEKWGQPLVRVCMFMGACSVAGFGLDFMSNEGLLRNPVARGSIASVHGHLELPEITLDQAIAVYHTEQTVEKQNRTVWIDARYQLDYDLGHLPHALNLPIDATFAQEDALIASLPSDAKIVVYCQSEGCAFADAISQRLLGHGFKQIRIFRPGYRDWQESSGETHKTEMKKQNQGPGAETTNKRVRESG
jgi:rhodanese-related sulfurtransferase